MMPFAQFEAAAAKINYYYRIPGTILYGLVKWLRPTSVVEVGTHVGMSAVWMARALQENGGESRLYCIDSFCWTEHDQLNQWQKNVAECGVASYIQLLRGRSQEVEWPARIDMAYIDGNHTYPVVRHDVHKAMERGATLICMHDTVQCEGSRKYAETFRGTHGGPAGDWDVLEENSECGLMICKKRQPKPPCTVLDTDEKWDKGA